MFSGLYSVQGMINQIIKEAKFSDPNIILTGGFGELISNKLDINSSNVAQHATNFH